MQQRLCCRDLCFLAIFTIARINKDILARFHAAYFINAMLTVY